MKSTWKRMKTLSIIATSIVGLSLAASAATAKINVTTTGHGQLGWHVAFDVNAGGVSYDRAAGQFFADIVSGNTTVPPHTDPFLTYCLDIGITFDGAVKFYESANFPLPPNGNPSAVPPWVANGGQRAAFLYDTYQGSVVDDEDASALQLAIWEVIHDEDYSMTLDTGSFYMEATSRNNGVEQAAAIAQAQAYIDGAKNLAGFSDKFEGLYWDPVLALNDNMDSQALLGDPRTPPIPEPSQVLGLLALAGYGIFRKFKKA